MVNQYLSDSDINTSFLDEFCSGHLVVNVERKIIFCNTYIATLSQVSPTELIGSSISDCFTKASNIFFGLLYLSIIAKRQRIRRKPNVMVNAKW